jgi:hypothetical protein
LSAVGEPFPWHKKHQISSVVSVALFNRTFNTSKLQAYLGHCKWTNYMPTLWHANIIPMHYSMASFTCNFFILGAHQLCISSNRCCHLVMLCCIIHSKHNPFFQPQLYLIQITVCNPYHNHSNQGVMSLVTMATGFWLIQSIMHIKCTT